jgi:excisionase family DNA binding protein
VDEKALSERRASRYLRTGDVAGILHISPKTVTRWARDGKLPHSRTLGGHRRFPAEAIEQLARQLNA